MPRFVAFLRAINVGGRIVKMERLRKVFESIGFTGVETFIASGNVIFEARATTASALERKIETALQHELGYVVTTFVRTDRELAAIAGNQPFDPSAVSQSLAFTVGFVAAEIGKDARANVERLRSPLNDVHVDGREIYWLSRTLMSDSTIGYALFEKAMGQPATFRNVNTVRRMAAKYPPASKR